MPQQVRDFRIQIPKVNAIFISDKIKRLKGFSEFDHLTMNKEKTNNK